MSVVVIGLNHRTVPLDLLERMTISESRLPKALADLAGREHLSEAVVLSTCNRTEVYAVAERFHGAYQDIRNFLAELAFLPPEGFSDHLYTHYDEAAVAHLFTVATGIDSAVLGESEILGQVKGAWERAQAEQTAGPVLNLVFRQALETGKRARTDTDIARNITSVSQPAVAMAPDRLGGLTDRSVGILGAGEMGEGIAVARAAAGVADVRVANRPWDRALALADRVGGRAVRLTELPDTVAEVDVLLTSTGASSIMLEHGELEPVFEARDRRPLLIVDIAVPRDVDPAVGELDGVTLLDMDDLRAFADRGLRERRREVAAVVAIVAEELDRFRTAHSAREVAPLVAALHERAETLRQGELARFRGRLDGLGPREAEAVEALTRGILAKVLHEPTVRLKDAAGTRRGDRLADTLRDLYDLYDT